jgi:DNA adenine methylase
MIAFAYYGGKNRLANDLIALMPPHDHYCEPFGGSLAVLFAKEPANIETVNDLNSDLVHFFRTLRDNPDPLIHALELTPYSREEFIYSWDITTDPIERARRFYVRVSMDISKAGRHCNRSWASNRTYVTGAASYTCKNWVSKIDGLPKIVQRLRNVQIENLPALKIIQKYDSASTFFYLDPPYLHSSRTSKNDYIYEMNLSDHKAMIERLNSIKGLAMVSGYEDKAANQLFHGWHKHTFPARQVSMSKGNGRIAQEVVWMNYDPTRLIQKQLKLNFLCQ